MLRVYCACFIIDKFWLLGKRFSNPMAPHLIPISLLSPPPTYRVDFTFSANGSNCTVMRLTPLRLTLFNCFPMAETMPPERRNAPLNGTDILNANLFNNNCGKTISDWFYNNTQDAQCCRIAAMPAAVSKFLNVARLWKYHYSTLELSCMAALRMRQFEFNIANLS